jgi:polygalacturonase
LGATILLACSGTPGSGPAAGPDAASQGSGGLASSGGGGSVVVGGGGMTGGRGDGGAGGSGIGGGGGPVTGGGAAGSSGVGASGGMLGRAGTTGGGGTAGSGGEGGTGKDGGTTDGCSWRNGAPVTVATPFAAPDNSLTFTPPTIPCVMFPITSYGAKPTGSNTAAFAATVAAAKAAGGGVVDVPAGQWTTGAIRLDSNIELHLESGATIGFTTTVNATEYPTVLTRWEGLDVMNWSPMIYALGATNVAITGTGTLQGPGNAWGGGIDNWKNGSVAEAQRIYRIYYSALPKGVGTIPSPPTSVIMNGLRPAFIECNGCTSFLVDGPTVTGSAYWTIHPLYSNNVIVRNLSINTTATSANGDGTDPDSCVNCLIDNVTYATSDDIIAIKSGLNEDGIAVGKPTHNLVIRNITATAGHALAVGSEISGGVDNVYVTSTRTSSLGGMQSLFRLKTLAGRGGTSKNIFYENVTGAASVTGLEITTAYTASTIAPHDPSLIPLVSGVHFSNVSGNGGVALTGISTSQTLQNISFNAVTVTGASSCTHVSNLSLMGSSVGFTGTGCP